MAGVARMAALGASHVALAPRGAALSSTRPLRRGSKQNGYMYGKLFSLATSPTQPPAFRPLSSMLSSSPSSSSSFSFGRNGSSVRPAMGLGNSPFLGWACRGEKKVKKTTHGGADCRRKLAGPVASSAAAGDVSGDASSGAGTLGKASESAVPEKKLTDTLMLGALFGLWYLFNIYFNIYNKQVLKVFPYPITLTTIQLLTGSVFIFLMWTTGLHKRPKITGEQLLRIAPLAVAHLLGNMLTNVSLGKVSVSFTHTIKALEPFFTVLLSALFLGEFPKPLVLASLVPIVGGVGLASMSEVSFNWPGFWSAMGSNLTFQSRNVLSKKAMKKTGDEKLDNINLFSIITLLSLAMVMPFTLLTEGIKFTPEVISAAGLNVQQIMTRSLLAAICFHAYQQVSYMILERVNPVTHSVGNCVKRVVVIVSSVVFFQTPVSAINALGTAIALGGVFAYSRVKALAGKSKKN